MSRAGGFFREVLSEGFFEGSSFHFQTKKNALSEIMTALQKLPVSLRASSKEYLGDLYWVSSSQNQPLVLLVHEWWGKTSLLETRARRLAKDLGCAMLVVDLYGEGRVASDPEQAGKFAQGFYEDPRKSFDLLKGFMERAQEEAKKAGGSLDAQRIAAIGYCFGGTQVLHLARQGASLVGVISCHGGLRSSFPVQKIKPKVLVLHGSQDQMVPPEEVQAFYEEMEASQADFEFHAYPHAEHGFTNPDATEIGKRFGLAIAYDAQADEDSWKRICLFLRSLF